MPQCQLVDKWLHDLVFIILIFDNLTIILQGTQRMRGSCGKTCAVCLNSLQADIEI